jgi:ligand-binding sensor domain-containing protein
MRTFLMVTLLICLPLSATAQKYLALQYGRGEGLPSEEVRDMITGEHGFLWVATDGGLVRFDGERFTSYNRALDSYYIKALARDTAGQVIFINDSGLFRLTHQGDGSHYRLDTAWVKQLVPASPLPADSALYYPNGLLADRHGQFWVSQPDGRVARIRDGSIRFFQLHPPFEGLGSRAGYTFAESPEGMLFAGSTSGQLFRYLPEEERFERQSTPTALKEIHCLLWQGSTLLIGGNGLYRCAIKPGQVNQWHSDPLQGQTIQSLAQGSSPNHILVGTARQGLRQAVWKGSRWALKVVYGANDPHRINVLPFQKIHQIYRDTRGNIWLGTAQGLGLLQSRFFETVFGLANNNTLTTLPLPTGEVLISYGDVFTINAREGAFFAEALPNLNRGLITALAHTGGQLFLGTTSGSLLKYKDGRLFPDLSLEERGGGIFFMTSGSDGSVWICQAPDENPIVGIARRRPNGQLQAYGAESGLESRILVARESPRQRLYAAGIGPQTYLYRYLPEEDAFINLSLPLPFVHSTAFEVHDMAIDPRGMIWLATTDGLMRYDLERIQRVDLGPYTTTEIRAVAATEDNQLWLSTSTEGLIYYDEEASVYTLFDQESGLPSTVGAYRCLSRSADGRIWVGTAEGTVYSRDAHPQPLPTQKPLLLSVSTGSAVIAPNDGQPLDIRPKDRLSVKWASPTFPAQWITYRYRLKTPTDSNWIAVSYDNALQLSNLPAGTTGLEIQARKPGGHTWSGSLPIALKVRPPWYRRWWAIALWVALGFLLLYVFFSQVIGRLVRYIQILKEKVRVRDQTIEAQRNLLAEQSAGLAQQESDLQAMSARQTEDIARSLPLIFLEHLFSGLSTNAGWPTVMEHLKYALNYHSACDLWELGWYESESLYTVSYRSGHDEPTLQTMPFEEKSALPAWLLVNGTPLLLNHFSQESEELISPEGPATFESLIGVKREIPGKQPFVLILSAHRKDAFSRGDLQSLELLAQHIALVIRQPLQAKHLEL